MASGGDRRSRWISKEKPTTGMNARMSGILSVEDNIYYTYSIVQTDGILRLGFTKYRVRDRREPMLLYVSFWVKVEMIGLEQRTSKIVHSI